MQDIEFTIEDGKLWMLQTRTGKRNGQAAIRMAVEMAESRLISKETALLRVNPDQIDELLHPSVDPEAGKKPQNWSRDCRPVPAGPSGRSSLLPMTPRPGPNGEKR